MNGCDHCDHAGCLGVYRGIVTNDADPEGLYRVKALVPQVLGEQESQWAWPCVPAEWWDGMLQDHIAGGTPYSHVLQQSSPSAGQGVWVMFEGGDTSKPLWLGTWRTP